MARRREKRKREPRDFKGSVKQALINKMTNYWRCRWSRAGYPDSIQSLETFAYPFGKPTPALPPVRQARRRSGPLATLVIEA